MIQQLANISFGTMVVQAINNVGVMFTKSGTRMFCVDFSFSGLAKNGTEVLNEQLKLCSAESVPADFSKISNICTVDKIDGLGDMFVTTYANVSEYIKPSATTFLEKLVDAVYELSENATQNNATAIAEIAEASIPVSPLVYAGLAAAGVIAVGLAAAYTMSGDNNERKAPKP